MPWCSLWPIAAPALPTPTVISSINRSNRAKDLSGKTGGTGLGLTIANRLAELQGGVLRHIGRAGGGTVFVYRVPAADAPQPAESVH
ncbi:MAG: ATP-binding protein [Longimicrobiales bacterium]